MPVFDYPPSHSTQQSRPPPPSYYSTTTSAMTAAAATAAAAAAGNWAQSQANFWSNFQPSTPFYGTTGYQGGYEVRHNINSYCYTCTFVQD